MPHRLIYLSSAAHRLGHADLEDIVLAARRNNGIDGITGLLLFHEGRFFQVLEGRRGPILACYLRIKRDRRHTDIRRIWDGPATGRAFPGWRMGFARPETISPDLRSTIIHLGDLVPPDAPGRGTSPDVRLGVRDFLEAFTGSGAPLLRPAR